jgi:hypothetical protein
MTVAKISMIDTSTTIWATASASCDQRMRNENTWACQFIYWNRSASMGFMSDALRAG